ncbi:hypothetical protein KUCAC02_029745, partial [Chaenocephalus aceratus]
ALTETFRPRVRHLEQRYTSLNHPPGIRVTWVNLGESDSVSWSKSTSPSSCVHLGGNTMQHRGVTFSKWGSFSGQVERRRKLDLGLCVILRELAYFRGSLSGLTIRPGKIESQKVISCLQACKEGLDINSLESLDKNIKFHFNPAQSILVMEGEDLENMNTAVRKVAYINSRQFPTPGIRRLHISTTVQYVLTTPSFPTLQSGDALM